MLAAAVPALALEVAAAAVPALAVAAAVAAAAAAVAVAREPVLASVPARAREQEQERERAAEQAQEPGSASVQGLVPASEKAAASWGTSDAGATIADRPPALRLLAVLDPPFQTRCSRLRKPVIRWWHIRRGRTSTPFGG